MSIALLLTGLVLAQSPSLLVLSKGNHTLSIVDPNSLKVLGTMPSGEDPHEVEASSDGKFAYISNYGGGSLHTITVADLKAKKSGGVIDLGALRGPHGLMYAGGKLWFTAEGARAIGSYDPPSKKIDWILGTGQGRTHMIWVSHDLARLVTSNVSSATMTIIDKTVNPGGRGSGWTAVTDGLGRNRGSSGPRSRGF